MGTESQKSETKVHCRRRQGGVVLSAAVAGLSHFRASALGHQCQKKDAHARCSAPRGYAQACRAFVIALVLLPRVRGGLLAAKT